MGLSQKHQIFNKALRYANNKLIDKNCELIDAEEKNRVLMDIHLSQYENINDDELAAKLYTDADKEKDVNIDINEGSDNIGPDEKRKH